MLERPPWRSRIVTGTSAIDSPAARARRATPAPGSRRGTSRRTARARAGRTAGIRTSGPSRGHPRAAAPCAATRCRGAAAASSGSRCRARGSGCPRSDRARPGRAPRRAAAAAPTVVLTVTVDLRGEIEALAVGEAQARLHRAADSEILAEEQDARRPPAPPGPCGPPSRRPPRPPRSRRPSPSLRGPELGDLGEEAPRAPPAR